MAQKKHFKINKRVHPNNNNLYIEEVVRGQVYLYIIVHFEKKLFKINKRVHGREENYLR